MKRLLAVAVVVFLIGCEKKVDFTLHDQPDKLVVEGIIENDQPPVVILSKSIGYFSTISADVLNQSFVHGADVFVSNGSLTHKLREYSAVTSIPKITKSIDSVWWKKAPVTSGSDTNKVLIMVRATDPPGFGDYVRYYTKTNREPFYPPLNSTFDDYFIDGTTYELQIDKGVDRNLAVNFDQIYFKRGDTVGLKLSN